MGKPSMVIVLTEDETHQRFVRHYLYQVGYSIHDIRFEALPSGRGCGEQWVRQRYAGAVRACRERTPKAKTALVVVIDADTADVNQRSNQFHQALRQEGLGPRTASELIAHLIPKRNIETWVLCLHGTPVDETTDYRAERDIDQKIQVAAVTLHKWTRPNATLPAYCTASLRAAIPEIKRIE
jgi:hypothetical protein